MAGLAFLGGAVIVIFFTFFNAFFSGYALSMLWGWFMVPTFGLPTLQVVPAIGIAMVVSYLTNHEDYSNNDKRKTSAKLVDGIVVGILKPLFALFAGYIVHLFM